MDSGVSIVGRAAIHRRALRIQAPGLARSGSPQLPTSVPQRVENDGEARRTDPRRGIAPLAVDLLKAASEFGGPEFVARSQMQV